MILKRKIHQLAASTMLATALLSINPRARAQEATNVDVQALLQRVKELEEKVKALEQNQDVGKKENLETNKATAVEQLSQPKKDPPQLIIGQDGFGFKSADGNFALKLEGVLQIDSRTFFSDHGIPGNDGFLLRRARPIIEGTVFRDFDFEFIPDFGTGNNGGNAGTAPSPQIFDAWLNYRYSPALQLRVGKFKSPIGLEQLQADAFLTFNERSLATDLVPNRDLGVMLHGELWEGLLDYAGGIFNGVGDQRNSANSAFSDDKAGEGRLFVQPFKPTKIGALEGFGFGIGGGFGTAFTAAGLPATTGGTTPGYATVGQEQFFAYRSTVTANGEFWHLAPQTFYHWGPVALLGEYVISDQAVATGAASRRLENKAWDVTASWVLTGENNTFTGVVPESSFDPKSGRWGAWELAARVSQANLDRAAFPIFSDPTTSAHSALEWSLGLNWWLNKNVRVMTSFSRTTFGGGGGTAAVTTAPSAVTRQPENTLFTRVQLAF
jgi:phosphate-selective porin OprO/OprP